MTARAIILAVGLGAAMAGAVARAESVPQTLEVPPATPCGGIVNGMFETDPQVFGHAESGFVWETWQALKDNRERESRPAALDGFDGIRLVDCRSGAIVAMDRGFTDEIAAMLEGRFLAGAVTRGAGFALEDVQRAAKAAARGRDDIRLLALRETEQTCGCAEFFPRLWKH
ncbi:MAG: hypothetical protein R3D85_10210 [Paracoccaceae bacterium]